MSHPRTQRSLRINLFMSITVWLVSLWLMTSATAVAQEQSPLFAFGRPTTTRASNVRNVYPYRAVAKILVTFRDNYRSSGTGVFIYANAVLTAAHVVYKPEHGGLAVNVEIMPGYDGGIAPFGSTGAKMIAVASQYRDYGDRNYDFAAILTTTRLGDRSGWLGYQRPPNSLRSISIIGYPQNSSYGFDGHTMFASTSGATLVGNNKIEYVADTYDGMSGAPIIITVGGDYRVIGVHNSGGFGRPVNLGTSFFDEILRNFPPG